MASDALCNQDAGFLKLPQGLGRLAPGPRETPVESRWPSEWMFEWCTCPPPAPIYHLDSLSPPLQCEKGPWKRDHVCFITSRLGKQCLAHRGCSVIICLLFIDIIIMYQYYKWVDLLYFHSMVQPSCGCCTHWVWSLNKVVGDWGSERCSCW